MVHNERSSSFVAVNCSCGRALRAKMDQVGSEVRCWDCHQMVLVSDPGHGQRVARELSDGALNVIQGPGLTSVLVASIAITAVLVIPNYGVWCAVGVLTLAASAYGEIIRRVSRGPSEVRERGWLISLLPRSVPKLVLGFLQAAGTVVPLWWLNSGWKVSPHWDRIGCLIAVGTWLVAPLLIVSAYARTVEDAPLGLRRCLRIWAKHPLATFLALAIVPMSLVLTEVLLGLVFYTPGNLPFFALDYMPMPTEPGQPVMFEGVPYYRMLDYRNYPESIFYQGYFDGLHHGYSFVGALPASLSLSTRAGLDGEAIGLLFPSYLLLRVLLVLSIVVSMLAAFAIQAHWLGSIPALERKIPG